MVRICEEKRNSVGKRKGREVGPTKRRMDIIVSCDVGENEMPTIFSGSELTKCRAKRFSKSREVKKRKDQL